jgi:hypothetical protein
VLLNDDSKIVDVKILVQRIRLWYCESENENGLMEALLIQFVILVYELMRCWVNRLGVCMCVTAEKRRRMAGNCSTCS